MPSLVRMWRTYRIELRLLVFHWSFVLLSGLYLLLLFGGSYESETAGSLLLASYGAGTMPIISLVILLLSGLSVVRADRAHINVIENTLPTSVEQPFARWLAVMTIAVLFLLPYIIITAQIGPNDVFWYGLPIFLLDSLAILGLTSALVWLLYYWVGNRRWLFPFFFMIWIGLIIGPTLINSYLEDVINAAPWILLFSAPMGAYNFAMYSDVWGRLLAGNIYTYTTLTYLFVLVLMLAVVGLLTLRQRMYRWSMPLVAIGVFAMIGTVGSAAAYTSESRAEYAIWEDAANFVQSEDRRNFDLAADLPYVVTDYTMTLDYSDAESPYMNVQMTFDNRSDEALEQLIVTLNPQLELKSASTSYEQKDAFIYLILDEPLQPQTSLTVDLAYDVAIWWYKNLSPANHTRATYFTKDKGVNLACAVAWYPIPGRILFGQNEVNAVDDSADYNAEADCLLDEPASFDLSILGGENMTWASNLSHRGERHFTGHGTWLDLLAGTNIVAEERGSVTFVASDIRADDVREAIDIYYQPAIEYLHQFFPEVESLNLWAVSPSKFVNEAPPINNGRLTIIDRTKTIIATDTSPLNGYWSGMNAMMRSLLPYRLDDSLVMQLSYFLEVNHLADHDPDVMMQLLTDGIPQGEGGSRYFINEVPSEDYPVTMALYDVYQQGGDAAIKEILQTIHSDSQHFAELSIDEVAEWIRNDAN